jgi:DNA ligase-1
LGIAQFEYKMDGARVQVHKSGSEIRIFTRRLNDVTAACPEIAEAIGALSARELILDGETLALREDGTPHAFQTTMKRFGRKLDVANMRGKLPLTPFFFDCLLADGESLIDRKMEERMKTLEAILPSEMRVPRIVTADADQVEAFAKSALDAGHEGIMAKALDATYDAGGRGYNWLKLKPVHTLDLVVLAAEWGSGRRRGWLSNLHLGARDPSTGGFVMLGKTFKGMTDEMLAWQTERLQELEVSRDRWTVFVRPELVVEVAFSDVQESPTYPGGMTLRFARIKRYRTDKAAAQADTVETVRTFMPSSSSSTD